MFNLSCTVCSYFLIDTAAVDEGDVGYPKNRFKSTIIITGHSVLLDF